MPANFRTYEGQLRLLTAVIAAHPSLKLDYKEIHKYFGESTPDGLQFQFRAIKQQANNMRQGKGASVPGPSTPGGSAGNNPKTPRATGGGRKRAAPSTSSKTPAGKKSKMAAMAAVPVDDDDEDDIYVPAPKLSPLITDEAMRAEETKTTYNYATTTEAAPSLASARAASPDDDEDVKVITPADASGSFSYNHASTPGYHSFGQAQAQAAVGGARYESSPFYNGGSGHALKSYVADEEDDEEDAV